MIPLLVFLVATSTSARVVPELRDGEPGVWMPESVYIAKDDAEREVPYLRAELLELRLTVAELGAVVTSERAATAMQTERADLYLDALAGCRARQDEAREVEASTDWWGYIGAGGIGVLAGAIGLGLLLIFVPPP